MAIAAITLGYALNHLLNKTEKYIDRVKGAGLELEIEAGVQIRKAIQNAQVAYTESLDHTYEKVDRLTKSRLEKLELLLSQAETRIGQLVEKTIIGAQQVANSFPGGNTRPQLRNSSPLFVIRTDDRVIVFTFDGNFVHAAEKNFTPQLTFNGKSFPPVTIQTQKLIFRILPSSIFSRNAFTESITYSEGELTVPWQGVLPLTYKATFKVTVGALPSKPGKIFLEWITNGVQREERLYKSPIMRLDSGKDGGRTTHKNHSFEASPNVGWKKVFGRSVANYTIRNGRCDPPKFHKETDEKVTYRGSTFLDWFNRTGKMDVSIEFPEWRNVPWSEQHRQELQLKWGDSAIISHSLGTWKVVFYAFNGTRKEFAGVDISSSPYVKIVQEGGHSKILVMDPETPDNFLSFTSKL